MGLQTQLRELTTGRGRSAWPAVALSARSRCCAAPDCVEAVASGVAVSVAAVPEGLALVATLAQQASARRLTRLGALVRTPRSVEALGRVDVVCFDKTGTLARTGCA